MEGLADTTQNILDACTIINFIHIDEDEFLMRQLKSKKINLSRKVFEETNKNVLNKFKHSINKQNLEIKNSIKEIEYKLNYFREIIYYPEDYYQLKEEVASLTRYPKENGEFISVLLSYYLSKYEGEAIIFHTDDIPAKYHFTPFFECQKIGSIYDSIDLLISLQSGNKEFTSNALKKYFSNLYSEYTFSIGGLLKDINEFRIPKKLIRNSYFRNIIISIRQSLKSLDILSLIDQYYLVLDNKIEFRDLFNILSKYEYFFKQKISNEYLNKIKSNYESIN